MSEREAPFLKAKVQAPLLKEWNVSLERGARVSPSSKASQALATGRVRGSWGEGPCGPAGRAKRGAPSGSPPRKANQARRLETGQANEPERGSKGTQYSSRTAWQVLPHLIRREKPALVSLRSAKVGNRVESKGVPRCGNNEETLAMEKKSAENNAASKRPNAPRACARPHS